VHNNYIYDNVCPGFGAGINVNNGDAWINNNIIYNNIGAGIGPFMTTSEPQNTVYIENNIIWGNTGHGIQTFNKGIYQICNNIFARNTPEQIYALHPGSIFDVQYNNIEAGFDSGFANIDTTLMFADTSAMDFHLLPASPMIDAGDPDSGYADACSPPGMGTERNDLGVYGGWYNCVWDDTTLIATAIRTPSSATKLPEQFRLEQNYPNPFNPETNIRFSIVKPARVRLTVYNLLGQQVAELVDEYLKAGIYEIDWKAGELPSGLYFYTLKSAAFSQTRKMMLLR